MSVGLNGLAAAAALLLAGANAASAQPSYGYGELPPPPYQEAGGRSYAGGCGGDRFTLLGAHAGVTVLGVDLGAGAGLSVPTGEACGGPVESFQPRAYAPSPPPPEAYAPSSYGYAAQSYGPPQAYGPPMPPAYPPCGCEPPRW